MIISYIFEEYQKNKKSNSFLLDFEQGYQDSNLEMTESESVALPFGDSPISHYLMYYT